MTSDVAARQFHGGMVMRRVSIQSRGLVLLAAALLLILASIGAAQAATITVTTTADTDDVCDTDCSLRE